MHQKTDYIKSLETKVKEIEKKIVSLEAEDLKLMQQHMQAVTADSKSSGNFLKARTFVSKQLLDYQKLHSTILLKMATSQFDSPGKGDEAIPSAFELSPLATDKAETTDKKEE